MAAATGASLRERMGHSSTRAAMIYQHATREPDEAIATTMGGADPSPRGERQGHRHATGTREGSARMLRSLGWVSCQESSFTSAGTAVMVAAPGSGSARVGEIPVIVSCRRAPVFSCSSITKGSFPGGGDASRAWDTALWNVPAVSGLAFAWFSRMLSRGSSARRAPAGPPAAR
jgi:hypothetical protein